MPVAVGAPLTAAVVHHAGSASAVGLSAMVALAGAAAAILRFVLSEILRHVQRGQQQRDQHREAMFREGNHHAEVMLVLDAATSAVDVVALARAIGALRGTTTTGPDT